jgi:Trypsin-co-occurring domain 1
MSLAKMRLDSGESILVEVDVVPRAPGDVTKVSAGAKVIETFDFSQTLSKLKEPIKAVMKTFEDMDVRPDKLNLEFSVKFSGEGGIIFASAKGEAGMVVKLEWAPKVKEKGASS